MTMQRIGLAMILAATASNAMASTEMVSVNGPAGLLQGTKETADTKTPHRPVVLIIPGSGPTDRDGNSPLGIKAAPYRLLAEGLASSGIDSVRIDKRGLFGSTIAGLDANDVTIEDYAADISAWVAKLSNESASKCVWLLGHSEGALVAEVAAKQTKGICGVILLAGAGRNLADVIKEQLSSNPANAPILQQALSSVDSLKEGHRVDIEGFPAPLKQLFRPAVQGFLINAFSYDPQAVLAQVTVPVLVVQGTSDLQVSEKDAQRLAEARPGIDLRSIQGMNHVLKDTGDDRAANLASYGDPSKPLHPQLIQAISEFIKKH